MMCVCECMCACTIVWLASDYLWCEVTGGRRAMGERGTTITPWSGGGALSGESRDLSILPPAMMVRGCKDVKMIGCDDRWVRW